jgi:hypothetical protein
VSRPIAIGLVLGLVWGITEVRAAPRAAGSAATDERRPAAVIGRVFLDRDGDGCWSAGDVGLAGARLLTDSGLEVRTDARGRYHLDLLAAGREVGAGRVLVLDAASLPAAARVQGGVRRLIQLVPDGVQRQDYAVRQPVLQVAAGRGWRPARGRVRLRLQPLADGGLQTELAGLAPEGCRVRVDGQAVEPGADGVFQHTVRITPGINRFLVSLHCRDGRLELIQAAIHWTQRPTGGDLVVPAAPRSLAICTGPPPGRLERADRLVLSCRPQPGVQLALPAARPAGQAPAEADRRRFELPLAPGRNEFAVHLHTAAGHRLAGRIGWRVAAVHWVGSLYGNLALAYGLGGGANGPAFGGRLGGYLEASLPWDARLVLGGELESFATAGLAPAAVLERALRPEHRRDRFERAPEPETGWPCAGDASRLRDNNPTGSRYHLALQRRGSALGWGGFHSAAAAGHPAPGRHARTLVGAWARLRPLADWFPGPRPALDLRLEGFWSQPDAAAGGRYQAAAREEHLATGGSLYWLGHGELVEGSERLVVERRDLRTGLVLARRRLLRHVDYQLDWRSGRVLLSEPLAAGALAAGAVRLSATGDEASVLVIEYEHLVAEPPAAGEQIAGGRLALAGRPGAGLKLGGSFGASGALRDGRSDYRLLRSRIELGWGSRLQLWAGWAASDGRPGTRPAYSADGGLSLVPAAAPEPGRGQAVAAGAALALGPLRGRLHFRRYGAGYTDSRWWAGSDLTQGLAQLEARLAAGLQLDGRLAGSQTWGGRSLEGRLQARWRPWAPLELQLAGAYAGAFPGAGRAAFERAYGDGQQALVGLRAAWRLGRGWALIAGHQQSVFQRGRGRAGSDLTLTTLGGQAELGSGLLTRIEGGWGPELGTVLRLGLSRSASDRRAVFATTTLAVDDGGLGGGWLSAGQRGRDRRGWTVSTSQTLGRDAAGESRGQRVGLELPLGRRWRLNLAYERAELHRAGAAAERHALVHSPFFDRGVLLDAPGRRDAVFGRLGWIGRRLQLSGSAELRLDEQHPLALDATGRVAADGPTSHRQVVLRLAGRWRALDALSLGGRVAWSETFGAWPAAGGPGVPEGGFLEAAVGLAWRPPGVDWLRLVARAAGGWDERPPAAGSRLPGPGSEKWFSGSVAALLRPVSWLQPALVLAPWTGAFHPRGGGEVRRASGMVGMLRLGSEVWAGLGLAAEMRLALGRRDYALTPEPAGAAVRPGAAAEIFYRLEDESLGGLRFSLGYSFSDVPDPLLSDLHLGRQGLFVRLEGML